MARNTLKLISASTRDIENLGYWYDLAGVKADNRDEQIAQLLAAHTAGKLGVAFGNGLEGNLDRILTLDQSSWYHARLAVRTLTLNDETIGLAMFGAHQRLWQLLDTRVTGDERSLANFLASALAVSKLHILAIRPDYQCAGYGTRLIKKVLGVARADNVVMFYGQFSARRPHLRKFYESVASRSVRPVKRCPLEWPRETRPT